ncbi:hypothetical protein [Rosenbergiella australiborealis]|uniref:hypothetical protein n=1 Tax=Rosenbergiella australiborealis TaxID=1544696 RepID=UPI001F4D8336|nr:hypothetical protein [Rosenbergiella australiborealis]
MSRSNAIEIGQAFTGWMTNKGPVIISHPDFNAATSFNVQKKAYTDSNNVISSSDGGNMEGRISALEVNVSYIKDDVAALKSSSEKSIETLNSLDKNMAVVLEKLTTLKEAIDKKPSKDAVDSSISKAKLTVLFGVPSLCAALVGLFKVYAHFFL